MNFEPRQMFDERGWLRDDMISFDELLNEKLRSDLDSLFQNVEEAWRKERFDIFSFDVITGRKNDVL